MIYHIIFYYDKGWKIIPKQHCFHKYYSSHCRRCWLDELLSVDNMVFTISWWCFWWVVDSVFLFLCFYMFAYIVHYLFTMEYCKHIILSAPGRILKQYRIVLHRVMYTIVGNSSRISETPKRNRTSGYDIVMTGVPVHLKKFNNTYPSLYVCCRWYQPTFMRR